MKSLIIALLISITFTVPIHAQRQATYALLGPVRTMRTETANILLTDGNYVEGPRILNMTVSFTEDGRRPELCIYDEKGSLGRRIVIKYEGRKQVESINYDGAGRMWLRRTHLHDAEGRTLENSTYNGEGSLRSKTTLTRNDLGQVIVSNEYDARGTLLEKVSFTYNDAGQVNSVEQSSYRADGTLSFRESQTVAEKRRERLSYNRDGSLAGRSVRVDQQIADYAPDGSLKKSTLIKKTGRLLEESTYNPDGTIRKESQIPDELDAYGNWIKQTKWVSDAQGTRPVKVTYRILTYYQGFRF